MWPFGNNDSPEKMGDRVWMTKLKKHDLLKSLDSLGGHVSYFFYMSFDEPILTRFGAGKIVELMKNMGMKEDEMIASPLITAAMVNVQKKIEASVNFEIRAFSLEDWFDKNLRTTDLS
jgi:hypothetical protein